MQFVMRHSVAIQRLLVFIIGVIVAGYVILWFFVPVNIDLTITEKNWERSVECRVNDMPVTFITSSNRNQNAIPFWPQDIGTAANCSIDTQKASYQLRVETQEIAENCLVDFELWKKYKDGDHITATGPPSGPIRCKTLR